MKNFLFTLSIVLLASIGLSQSPQLINYQGILTDASGSAIINQNISVKITIRQGSATGNAVYTETHNVTTDNNGRFSLQIGSGASSDNLSDIQWQNGPYYCNIAIDPTGGSSYNDYGTFQLISVPYAFYADTAAVALNDNDTDNQNELQDLSQVLSQGNSANGEKITSLAAPTDANDAATKKYVDETIKNAQNSNRHYIRYALSASHSMTLVNTDDTIKFDYRYEDDESLFLTSTGEYFVPETGYYLITINLNINSASNITNPIMTTIKASGSTVTSFMSVVPGTGGSYTTITLNYMGKFIQSKKIQITIKDFETTNPRTLRSAQLEIIKL